VKYTPFYLWHRLVLQSGNKVELDAAATCSEIPLFCPYFAGPRLLYNVATNIKIDEACTDDRSLNANSRKACYVAFMINFVDAGRNKNCHCIWEACAGPWEQLGFLNCYDFLHDPGGDFYIFLDLLIGPSFFIIFRTP